MKILCVVLEYGYGRQSRGISYIERDGFMRSFETLGHTVVPFYYDKYVNYPYHKYVRYPKPLQEEVKYCADAVKPDLIFMSLFTNQFRTDTLDYLKSHYTTVAWFGDDQWRFDNFTSRYARHFTHCITTDRYAIAGYKRLGIRNVIHSQWAAIDAHRAPELGGGGYQYDVTFVGGFHPYRKWFIKTLRSKGVGIEVFGHGWPNGSLTADAMNRIFVTSKINLNIGNSHSFDVRYLLSGMRPLVYGLLRAKNSSQIKARNFEIPYFNGFQLTDYVPSLENYFDIGKEIVCYNDVDEAARLIKFYLENDVDREAIKQAGHGRAVGEHGFTHRLDAVLSTIEQQSNGC